MDKNKKGVKFQKEPHNYSDIKLDNKTQIEYKTEQEQKTLILSIFNDIETKFKLFT